MLLVVPAIEKTVADWLMLLALIVQSLKLQPLFNITVAGTVITVRSKVTLVKEPPPLKVTIQLSKVTLFNVAAPVKMTVQLVKTTPLSVDTLLYVTIQLVKEALLIVEDKLKTKDRLLKLVSLIFEAVVIVMDAFLLLPLILDGYPENPGSTMV